MAPTLCIALLAIGCSSARQAPQVEMFTIDDQSGYLRRPWSVFTPAAKEGGTVPSLVSPPARNGKLEPDWGDIVQSNGDVLAVNVVSLNLNELPGTITGSHDILLFVETFENAAIGEVQRPISTLVYTAENQMIPGRANFSNALAFGPTSFSGHSVKVNFTLLVLQRRQVAEGVSALDTIQTFTSGIAAATPYTQAIQMTLGLVKSILKAQRDVIAFDFSATFMAYRPEGLAPTVRERAASDTNAATREASARLRADAQKAALLRLSGLVGTNAMSVRVPIGESGEETVFVTIPQGAATRSELATALEGAVAEATIARLQEKHPDLPRSWVYLALDIRTRSADDAAVRANFLRIVSNLRALIAQRAKGIAKAQTQAILKTYGLDTRDTATSKGVESLLDVLLDDDTSELERMAFPERTAGTFKDGLLREQYPWLRYGMYALVTTARLSGDNLFSRQAVSTVADGRSLYFDGGFLYSDADRTLPLNASYLVFSVTPNQRAEDAKALASAAEESARRIGELKVDFTNTAQSMAVVTEAAENLRTAVARAGAEKVAEEAARVAAAGNGGILLEGKWKEEFERLWTPYAGVLGKTLKDPADAETIELIKAELVTKWVARIAALHNRR